jgi:hypothetical protein
MNLVKTLVTAAVALCAMQAQASTIVFADNFDGNALGLNATPAGWTVTGGTVDIIGNSNFFDFIPGSGRYIDLDGSTSSAGTLSRGFAVTSGVQYLVTFDLAGNHRNGAAESVGVNFGSAAGSYSLGQSAGWSPYSLTFTAVSSGIASLSFKNSGGDNIGMLLDNVNVSAVPEPETYALMLAGLAAVGFLARRRAA